MQHVNSTVKMEKAVKAWETKVEQRANDNEQKNIKYTKH